MNTAPTAPDTYAAEWADTERRIVADRIAAGVELVELRDRFAYRVRTLELALERARPHHDTTGTRFRLAVAVELLEATLAGDELELDAPRPAVVVIPCGGRKAPHAAPAGDLYVGSYHRAARRAADAVAARTGARVLILSALHGLLELDELVDPYELRMGAPGSVTADELRRQAVELELEDADVTILAGSAYAAAALAVWPDADVPTTGARGIGDHLALFARLAA